MAPFTDKDLLRNRNPAVSLGPFDGRVAALHPSYPNFYITTPNAEYILSPPGPQCNVYARYDGRYGQDDHTQWPQPFSRKFPHLACIPKKQEKAENSVMWDNPHRRDFVEVGEGSLGMGKWSAGWIGDLEKSCKWLMGEVALRLTTNIALSSHPLLPQLSNDLERSMNRLRALAMTFRGAMVSIRLVQRLWLELHALMDYHHLYLPSMEGRAPPPKNTKVLGCFVHDVDTAERLFKAGIPFWLIREVQTFHTENILSVDTVVQPGDIIVLDDYSVYAPFVYHGDSNDNRYLAIHMYTIRYIRYADPFAAGNPKGILPSEYDITKSSALAGPSRHAPQRSNVQSAHPYAKKRDAGSAGRNKFEIVCNPYMPACLEEWKKALRNVNCNADRYLAAKASDNDGRYFFPEPGIIASVANPSRRNEYLTRWELLRPLLVNRVSSDFGSIQLVSNQQWRMLLGARQQENTRSAKLCISIKDLCADMGIDLNQIHTMPIQQYSEQEAQRILWDLSELSFRFELLMLDRRAAAATAQQFESEEDKQKLMAPLLRELNVLKCFPFDESEPRHLGFVVMEHARKGLASRRIQERLPYLHALRNVMHWWDGYPSEYLSRLPFFLADAREPDLLGYERAIAGFYTQTFYRFFGRAAIVPMYLP